MARGKDGFESLLVKSEGGEAEEIVSEENGILISMMLRQYFMSLKIMGQWKMWGNSMDRHWKGVQKSMSETQLAIDPKNAKPKTLQEVAGNAFSSQSTKDTPPPSATNAKDEQPLDESDEEISADESEHVKTANLREERQLKLARKVTKKWWRLAGLRGQPKCCDQVYELNVDWTRVCIPFP